MVLAAYAERLIEGRRVVVGYAVSSLGFGFAMLVPLIFLGAGRLSVDCALARALGRKST